MASKFRRGPRFFESQHEDMQLLDFAHFTLDDVLGVRDMPEWREFSEAQLELLREHTDDAIKYPIENFEVFGEKLIVFHQALRRKSEELHILKERSKYRRRIELILHYGGRIVRLAADPQWAIAFDAARMLWEKVPESSTNCSIDLLVRVFDLNGTYRNVSHSYQTGLKMRNDIKKKDSERPSQRSRVPRLQRSSRSSRSTRARSSRACDRRLRRER